MTLRHLPLRGALLLALSSLPLAALVFGGEIFQGDRAG